MCLLCLFFQDISIDTCFCSKNWTRNPVQFTPRGDRWHGEVRERIPNISTYKYPIDTLVLLIFARPIWSSSLQRQRLFLVGWRPSWLTPKKAKGTTPWPQSDMFSKRTYFIFINLLRICGRVGRSPRPSTTSFSTLNDGRCIALDISAEEEVQVFHCVILS